MAPFDRSHTCSIVNISLLVFGTYTCQQVFAKRILDERRPTTLRSPYVVSHGRTFRGGQRSTHTHTPIFVY